MYITGRGKASTQYSMIIQACLAYIFTCMLNIHEAEALRLPLQSTNALHEDFLTDLQALELALGTGLTADTWTPPRPQKEQEYNASTWSQCWKEAVLNNPRVSKTRRPSDIDPHSIVIATVMFGFPKDVMKIVLNNHRRYAAKHGYRYLHSMAARAEDLKELLHGRKGGWAKLAFIQNIFAQDNTVEYIFWMDADSLFVSTSVKLEDLLMLESRDFICAGDENGLNTGHMMIRNCQWSIQLLKSAWEVCPPPFFKYEQAGLMAMLGGGDPRDPSGWVERAKPLMAKLQSMKDAKKLQSLLPTETERHVTLLPECTFNLHRVLEGAFIWHMRGGTSPKSKVSKMHDVNDTIERYVRNETEREAKEEASITWQIKNFMGKYLPYLPRNMTQYIPSVSEAAQVADAIKNIGIAVKKGWNAGLAFTSERASQNATTTENSSESEATIRLSTESSIQDAMDRISAAWLSTLAADQDEEPSTQQHCSLTP
eukprot:gnl/TRDRNA2_/TRDRNA2_36418_c0_seq1.p1 gnl/TRDRNA2_/TRDRNA2_36418_c0~~gnl/TRDRNA2_/TRDRNA2_36418_c0_seq1.p1  ORF type:complete len:484 (-),score=87.78 gnl/TRDRNA2_/TRDRNA2_36418_c0_seq1:73-1524(-)